VKALTKPIYVNVVVNDNIQQVASLLSFYSLSLAISKQEMDRDFSTNNTEYEYYIQQGVWSLVLHTKY